MPGFSKVAIGLSYLGSAEARLTNPVEYLDALEDDCPDYAHQVLEDAIPGITHHVPERVRVPESEREAAVAALAKGMRLLCSGPWSGLPIESFSGSRVDAILRTLLRRRNTPL
jgi:hypothetical protein